MLFSVACGTSTDTPTVPDVQSQTNDIATIVSDYLGDNPIDVLERDFNVNWTIRTAQWDVPIYMQRDWVAWSVADAWCDMWGSAMFNREFMMCYLYNYAIFKSSDGNWYFGTKGWFASGPNQAFPDEQVYAIVVALEQHGEAPFWPVPEVPCS